MATTIAIYHAASATLRRLGRADKTPGGGSGLVTATVGATV